MNDKQHEAIAKWERRWLNAAGILLVVFVIFIAISLAMEGGHIAQRQSRATPEQLASSDLFANPGVTLVGTYRYRVALVAQTYSFNPSEIYLPIGSEATFYMTSRDVLHGYQVENTNINVELVPGEVSTFQYTFNEPGEYRVTCNEYCGLGHQNMLAKIFVGVRPPTDSGVTMGAPSAAESWPVLGANVYDSSCASCHQADGQGIAGVYPPLEEHAAHLYNAPGGRDYLVNLLLYGLQGPIEVEGATYNNQMPAWKQLGDDEIAAVLNHTLSSWKNEGLVDTFEPYQPEDIEPFRNEDLSNEDVYELRQELGLE